MIKAEPGDDFLAALKARLQAAAGDDDRVMLLFALAKIHDDIGRYEGGFAALAEANRLQRAKVDYDERERRSAFDRLAAVFTRELVAEKAGLGSSSDLPVFIVGFPRAGTTLVEQILASHPLLHGAGELDILEEIVAASPFPEGLPQLTAADLRALGEAYAERLQRGRPAAARISDKRPENYLFAGLIHLILPRARIIHVRRDPIDTCFSCFSLPLGGGFTCRGDLGELGRFYGMYAGLMAHWREVLPADAMLEVQYETLVDDLEGEARRLLDYCGLAWDERCLAFDRTERPVSTPSLSQVRQPLYRSSIQRWRRYEAHLAPLLQALGPLAGNAAPRR